MTPPLSTVLSTQKEVEVTDLLQEELIKAGSFESPEESAQRYIASHLISRLFITINSFRELVLGCVAVLAVKFVHKVMIIRGHSEAAARNAGGKLFTFGSYRLGVHGPGSDIDILCVAHTLSPCSRKSMALLMSRYVIYGGMAHASQTKTNIIITANISGVPIECVFARLALPSILDNLELKDDNPLSNLDERCVRSLGGMALDNLWYGYIIIVLLTRTQIGGGNSTFGAELSR